MKTVGKILEELKAKKEELKVSKREFESFVHKWSGQRKGREVKSILNWQRILKGGAKKRIVK